MLWHFSRGIVLEQHKEPALSSSLLEILNASDTEKQFTSDLPRKAEQLKAADILELARLSEIIDENDGKSLFQKLRRAEKKKYTIVVADAVDDEPYVSSQMCMVLQKPEELTLGIELCKKVLGVKKAEIALYRHLTDLETRLPRSLGGIPIRRISGRYPVQERTENAFPGEKVLLVGANALIHLARAFRDHRIQTTAFITVGGDAIHNPRNLEVPLGAPLSQVLDECGLTRHTLESIVIGGPMTGTGVTDPGHTFIDATTRAVLAFRENRKERQYHCIGCGRCVDVCPQNLAPFYLYQNIRKGNTEVLPFYDIDRCIECGTCSYICPAKLDVAALIIKAKHELAAEKKNAKASPEEAGEEEQDVKIKA